MGRSACNGLEHFSKSGNDEHEQERHGETRNGNDENRIRKRLNKFPPQVADFLKVLGKMSENFGETSALLSHLRCDCEQVIEDVGSKSQGFRERVALLDFLAERFNDRLQLPVCGLFCERLERTVNGYSGLKHYRE